MSDPTADLLAELRSLLDETTILSIAGDYDLADPQQLAAVREVLLTIAKDVPAEEATGFNPSGLGADGGGSEHRSHSDLKSNDGLTSTTEGLSVLSLTSSKTKSSTASWAAREAAAGAATPGMVHVGIFDGLSDAEKERQLADMFTFLKPVDVRLALKKAQGDASLAIDSLLNLQWLEQTGQRVKGVDGFYVSDDEVDGAGAPGKKRRKGKKKKAKPAKSPVSRSEPQSPCSPGSPDELECMDDEQHDGNIAFIAEKLDQPAPDVTNIYYRRGNSSGATIVEILDNFLGVGYTSGDQSLLEDLSAQSTKYPWVPRDYIRAALETSPSYGFAIDVIEVLGTFFEKPAYLKYNVAYSVVASDRETVLDSPGSDHTTGKQRQASKHPAGGGKVINLKANPLPPAQRSPAMTLNGASANTALLAASRDHSYASASAAFRKGRSDPLYRQAAGYYAERAREQATSHRQAVSAETSILVDRQSTRGMVDLHGATVLDGVEIALDRCWRWWEGLSGEDRARQAAREGFVVVTGLGRHSSDGRSRLRTHVFKALVEDGWKAEVLTGAYLVTGRRR